MLEDIVRAAVRGTQSGVACGSAGADDGGSGARRHESRGPVDDGRLLTALEAHGLASFALRLGKAHLSPPLTAVLKDRVRVDTVRALALVESLHEVHDGLRAVGVEAIPFKGPVLAAELYGDPTIRPSVDLDLLVRQDEMPRAVDALRKEGFRGGPERRLHAYLGYQNEIGLHRGPLTVELQWALVPRYFSVPFAIDPFWGRLRTCDVGTRRYPTLALEDQVVALLLHGAKHRWSRLLWVADVGVLMGKPIDWGRLLESAARARILRLCLAGLDLAGCICGIPLPAPVQQAVGRDRAVSSLAQSFRAALCADEPQAPRAFPLAAVDLRLREHVRDRVACLARAAFMPTRADWEMLPESLAGLAAIARPFRLARKWMPALRRDLRRVRPGQQDLERDGRVDHARGTLEP